MVQAAGSAVDHVQRVGSGQAGVARRVPGVDVDRFAEGRDGAVDGVRAIAARAGGDPAARASNAALCGRHGAGSHRPHAADAVHQLPAHLARDFLLHPEAVREVPLEAPGPEVGVARRLDQLGRHPHAGALPADRALDDVSHVQGIGDLREREVAPRSASTEVREMTLRLSTWASWLMISSVMPTLKYSSPPP